MPAAAYKTPGVYVEEISTLPPSVAEVSTAIPAFLGHTEKAAKTIKRVSTLLEYEEAFGGPKAPTIEVKHTANANPQVEVTPSDYLLYHAISHYFQNGGGSCYIVSVGNYDTDLSKKAFTDALAMLEKEDEPTLVVLTDAIALNAGDYYDVCQASLAHCHKLGDRFAILDVKDGDAAAFRDGIGIKYLDYGAAYHPYLKTTLNYGFDDAKVVLKDKATATQIAEAEATLAAANTAAINAEATAKTAADAAASAPDDSTLAQDAATAKTAATSKRAAVATAAAALALLQPALVSVRTSNTAFYQQVKKLVSAERITLPPSAAIAGVYASVDRDRGVWKAPANVSLSGVIEPTTKITNETQDGLNVHDTGKSINAIRAFTGKGTIVWGARTLLGNDNEWRYVPVRRLFIMIEESTRKASNFAVFEPNDASTWLKVKGMIGSFLYGLWERGALAGSTPEAAYFVEVGLGKTMTSQDILEGKMIVKIGVAAVRPAEFIILQFSHKLQEA